MFNLATSQTATTQGRLTARWAAEPPLKYAPKGDFLSLPL